MALLVIATAVIWSGVFELALLGWDTYPMIAAGRILSPIELATTFTEELMDGRYPLGHYWRPIAHLSFAVDYAVWGIEPFGYHVTDLALFAGVAIALATLARRLAGPGAEFGALVAGSVWVLHDAHLDLLTVAARRADTLAVLFTVCALAVQARGALTKRRSLMLGLFCAAALASKETGAIATPLVLAFALLDGRASRVERLARLLPAGIIVALTLALRTFVLDGIGGSDESNPAGALAGAFSTLGRYVGLAFVPFDGATNVTLCVSLAIAAGLGAGLKMRSTANTSRALSLPRVGILLVVWAGLLGVAVGAAGIVRVWYTVPFVAPVAIGLGLLANDAWAALRRPAPLDRLLGTATLALVVVQGVSSGAGTGLAAGGGDYEQVSRELELFLESFETRVRATEPGGTLAVNAAFEWVRLDSEGEVVRVIAPISTYGLEAYADLAISDRRVRVSTDLLPSSREPAPGDVVVRLNSDPSIERP